MQDFITIRKLPARGTVSGYYLALAKENPYKSSLFSAKIRAIRGQNMIFPSLSISV